MLHPHPDLTEVMGVTASGIQGTTIAADSNGVETATGLTIDTTDITQSLPTPTTSASIIPVTATFTISQSLSLPATTSSTSIISQITWSQLSATITRTSTSASTSALSSSSSGTSSSSSVSISTSSSTSESSITGSSQTMRVIAGVSVGVGIFICGLIILLLMIYLRKRQRRRAAELVYTTEPKPFRTEDQQETQDSTLEDMSQPQRMDDNTQVLDVPRLSISKSLEAIQSQRLDEPITSSHIDRGTPSLETRAPQDHRRSQQTDVWNDRDTIADPDATPPPTYSTGGRRSRSTLIFSPDGSDIPPVPPPPFKP